MYPTPYDDAERMAFLSACRLVDRPKKRALDDLTRLASKIFDAPIALVTLVTEHDQWFHGRTGLAVDGTLRAHSFCAHAIMMDRPFIVNDAASDSRFADNPLVTGEPGIRFYAGAPIITSGGIRLGAVCVIDREPRPDFQDEEARALIWLANMAAQYFEARRAEIFADTATGFGEATALAIITTDENGLITTWNRAAEGLFGFKRAEAIGQPTELIIPDRFKDAHRAGMERVRRGGGTATLVSKTVEVIARRADGNELPVELSLSAWSTAAGLAFGAHAKDISARRASLAALEHVATHDHLTGLLSSKSFRECLQGRLLEEQGASIISFDLVGFKTVNDSFGRDVGDALLQALAVRLQTIAGRDWTIGRLGGDEFIVLLPTAYDLFATREAASLLVGAFHETFLVAGHRVALAASVGIALAPDIMSDAEELLMHAELAVYRAKQRNDGKYQFFDSTMRADLAAKRKLNEEIRAAHALGQWQLYYQPQVRMSDGGLIGAEALLRWQHPQLGLLLPAAFMPALERHLVALKVGQWVLNESCRQLAIWRAEGLQVPRISCNLFGAQVHARTFEHEVLAALDRFNLQPSDLELEITETIALRLDNATLDPLISLVNQGVGIALDDFGTGFASLSTLKHVPLTRLKIDRSFVADICSDQHSAAVIDGIVSISRRLGIEVISEGVEAPEQQATLRALGCDDAQGYLFGFPLSAAEFTKRFTNAAVTRSARANRSSSPMCPNETKVA